MHQFPTLKSGANTHCAYGASSAPRVFSTFVPAAGFYSDLLTYAFDCHCSRFAAADAKRRDAALQSVFFKSSQQRDKDACA
jgi:hypothetical protein